MLPHRRRIPRALFPSLLSSRIFTHSPHFTLRFAPTTKEAQVAVSVSKKVSKSAVTRNTIRRRVYSALRERLSSLPKGLFLIVAKAHADKVRGEALTTELNTLFK